MTQPRFAALHSGLLVRKGAAEPSPAAPRSPDTPALDPYSIARRDAADAKTPIPPKKHPAHCAGTLDLEEDVDAVGFAMSDRQDRQLRLAAAKLNCRREQLLSRAIDEMLAGLGQAELSGCGCYRALGSD